mmetsp:Transcript_22816/g.45252  ORF Transcript_22816/g.45252 Transcript_22816/m.45252 type:complete len:238 (-) Transcript_22816:150-863(-)
MIATASAIVTLDSAMLVATITLMRPFGAGSKMRCCSSPVKVECSGSTAMRPARGPPSSKATTSLISSHPGKKQSTDPVVCSSLALLSAFLASSLPTTCLAVAATISYSEVRRRGSLRSKPWPPPDTAAPRRRVEGRPPLPPALTASAPAFGVSLFANTSLRWWSLCSRCFARSSYRASIVVAVAPFTLSTESSPSALSTSSSSPSYSPPPAASAPSGLKSALVRLSSSCKPCASPCT